MDTWRQVQRKNFTDWKKLRAFLQLDEAQSSSILTHSHFPLNLPLRLAEKMAKGTLNDPLLKQFLPMQEETKRSPLFVRDPVADGCARKTPKLLHKYRGRALITCTSACAMHCRFCFRQHFEYAHSTPTFAEELEAIRQDPSLQEIILSGGDPLSLSNAQLKHLIQSLETICHVRRLRFHTRFPIGIPERVDEEFLSLLASTRLKVFFVIHINHPKELDEDILQALTKMDRLGVSLLSQSVLLKGVNDNVETLVELFEQLVEHKIIPYYLHQLDRVEGAIHFEVAEEEGHQLMEGLLKRLPGYAIPRYVKEVAGADSKTPLHPIERLDPEQR